MYSGYLGFLCVRIQFLSVAFGCRDLSLHPDSTDSCLLRRPRDDSYGVHPDVSGDMELHQVPRRVNTREDAQIRWEVILVVL